MNTIRQQLVSFAQGSSTPVEAVSRALAAIAEHNPVYNALPTLVRSRTPVWAWVLVVAFFGVSGALIWKLVRG